MTTQYTCLELVYGTLMLIEFMVLIKRIWDVLKNDIYKAIWVRMEDLTQLDEGDMLLIEPRTNYNTRSHHGPLLGVDIIDKLIYLNTWLCCDDKTK